jgi:hypothetical protein
VGELWTSSVDYRCADGLESTQVAIPAVETEAAMEQRASAPNVRERAADGANEGIDRLVAS